MKEILLFILILFSINSYSKKADFYIDAGTGIIYNEFVKNKLDSSDINGFILAGIGVSYNNIYVKSQFSLAFNINDYRFIIGREFYYKSILFSLGTGISFLEYDKDCSDLCIICGYCKDIYRKDLGYLVNSSLKFQMYKNAYFGFEFTGNINDILPYYGSGFSLNYRF